MPMTPFFETAGRRAFEEMQRVFVPAGGTLPPGPYGFMELYCNEPDCDCRRVVIYVVRPDDAKTVWATLNFGWETADYYRRWSGDAGMADEMASATLEPSGPQTTHSPALLKLFLGIVKSDPDYVERLQRHYVETRAARGEKRSASAAQAGTGGLSTKSAKVQRVTRQSPRGAAVDPDRRPSRKFPREGFTILLDPAGLEVLVDEYHPKPLKLSWALLDQLRRDAQQ